MIDEEKVQHDYLLADFQATKGEIARRSNLQKAALAAVVAVYAVLFNNADLLGLRLHHIAGVWVVTILGYAFYRREGLEIERLGLIIRERIAGVAATKLNVPAEKIMPSEAQPSAEEFDYKARFLDRVFCISLFGIIPFFITMFYIFECTWERV